MTENLPAIWQGVEITYYDANWNEEKRMVQLPVRGLPPARRALVIKAAHYVSPVALAWLEALKVFTGAEQVMLSKGMVIHQPGPSGFWCENRDDWNNAKAIGPLPLLEALAQVYDEEAKRYKQPKPCRTCFASGLLMRKET